jgi:hypothetical protein
MVQTLENLALTLIIIATVAVPALGDDTDGNGKVTTYSHVIGLRKVT